MQIACEDAEDEAEDEDECTGSFATQHLVGGSCVIHD